MHHIRSEHSEIRDETSLFDRKGEIALSQENQYVILHRRGELVMMESYVRILAKVRPILQAEMVLIEVTS